MTRFLVMLAAVIVVSDAFGQARNRPGNLLNRNNRGGAPAAAPAANAGGTTTRTENKDIPALNWDAAPVDIVLQAYAEQVDKTYLKDPAVPNATITLKSKEGQKMTQEEYLEAIEVVLEMNGIHIEPYGEKFLRILPRKEVRKEGIPIIMDQNQRLDDSGKVVSMMVQLENISTEDGQKTLDNFKSASGIIIAFERTNSLLITDTEMNINRMLEIIRKIDVAMPVLENVFVRQIKNASAQDIKTALEAIVAESQKELEKSGGRNVNNAQPNNGPGGFRPGGNRPGLLGNGQNKLASTPNSSVLMQVSDADRGMIRGKVLILADERSNKLVIVTQKPNMDFFDKVIEQLDIETTPDTVVKVYRLKYAEAEEVSDMINDLIGNSGSSRSSGRDNQNRNARNGGGGNMTHSNTGMNASRKSANQRSGEAKAGELTKDNTTVLADERINGLVVMTEKELVPTIEQIIESMDIKLSQVLIETVIIEVTLGDGINTGMDWVQKGRQTTTKNVTTSTGANLYYKSRTTTMTNSKTGETKTSTSLLGDLVEDGYSYSKKSTSGDWTTEISETASKTIGQAAQISHDGLANYYTAGTYTALGGGQGGVLAQEVAEGVTSNLLGKAFNFIFDSDELGIKGILQASKTDSHSKYIASPIIMTLDNKEATIEATQMRYLFKGYQYSGSTYNGSAVPDYEQKELGITIKVTPKINPNGTVMLTLEEEYSQEGPKQGIEGEKGTFNAATTVTRKMSADALLENNQTVIFAGLTETSTSEAESGIPILKDIPWIGKWLFGTVSMEENRTELLVFMTPYVLDDAEAAQAEAIRRKRSVSDQHAWDDHGWSASPLAEPVSKKEQLRRLKAEWKKQDEERASKVAIEQEKLKRVKQLEKMSKDERKAWLEMHKEELKEEEKDELEKKMLDENSQEDLKKLAEQIKDKKLKEADKALDKASDELRQATEYERLKREREEKAAEKAEDKTTEEPTKEVEEAKADEKVEDVKAEAKVEEVKAETKVEEVKAEEEKKE